jgi:hypothetical protein
MESAEKLGYHGWNLHCSIYMQLLPLGYLRMECSEKMGHHGWNLLKGWATFDGIHAAAIYILFFLLGYLQMKCTEKIGHPGWNPMYPGWNQD